MALCPEGYLESKKVLVHLTCLTREYLAVGFVVQRMIKFWDATLERFEACDAPEQFNPNPDEKKQSASPAAKSDAVSVLQPKIDAVTARRLLNYFSFRALRSENLYFSPFKFECWRSRLARNKAALRLNVWCDVVDNIESFENFDGPTCDVPRFPSLGAQIATLVKEVLAPYLKPCCIEEDGVASNQESCRGVCCISDFLNCLRQGKQPESAAAQSLGSEMEEAATEADGVSVAEPSAGASNTSESGIPVDLLPPGIQYHPFLWGVKQRLRFLRLVNMTLMPGAVVGRFKGELSLTLREFNGEMDNTNAGGVLWNWQAKVPAKLLKFLWDVNLDRRGPPPNSYPPANPSGFFEFLFGIYDNWFAVVEANGVFIDVLTLLGAEEHLTESFVDRCSFGNRLIFFTMRDEVALELVNVLAPDLVLSLWKMLIRYPMLQRVFNKMLMSEFENGHFQDTPTWLR